MFGKMFFSCQQFIGVVLKIAKSNFGSWEACKIWFFWHQPLLCPNSFTLLIRFWWENPQSPIKHQSNHKNTYVQILQRAGKIESTGGRIVVTVLVHLQTGVRKDRRVIAPRRIRQIDLLVPREPLLEERPANAKRSRSTDTLHRCRSSLGHRRRLAQSQFDGQFTELRIAADRWVFLVQSGFLQTLLGLQNGGQDVRLAVVVAIGAHAEVDLFGVRVAFVGLRDAQNRVRWSHLDGAEPWSRAGWGVIINLWFYKIFFCFTGYKWDYFFKNSYTNTNLSSWYRSKNIRWTYLYHTVGILTIHIKCFHWTDP